MRNVLLYGHLKKSFGASFRLNVSTPAEAIRLLNANFPKFQRELRKGAYRLIVGARVKTGLALGLEEIDFRLGRDDFHIVPVAAGAGKGGALKVILGVALVGAAIFFSGGTLAAPLAGLAATGGGLSFAGNIAVMGVFAAVAGVAQMISPSTKTKETATEASQESFSIAGPTNNPTQGYPVPVPIGLVIVGGIAVSTGLDVEDISVSGATPGQTSGTWS